MDTNYTTHQGAYSEFVSVDKLWPDFTPDEAMEVIRKVFMGEEKEWTYPRCRYISIIVVYTLSYAHLFILLFCTYRWGKGKGDTEAVSK